MLMLKRNVTGRRPQLDLGGVVPEQVASPAAPPSVQLPFGQARRTPGLPCEEYRGVGLAGAGAPCAC